jgi:hypothetical protein
MLDASGSIFVLWGRAVQLRAADDTMSNPIVPLAKLGSRSPCGLDDDERVYCWRTVNNVLRDEPPSITGGPDGFHPVAEDQQFVAVEGTLLGTCGLSTGGVVTCFGHSSHGKGKAVGDPCFEVDAQVPCYKALTPEPAGAPAFRTLTAGFFHLCALTESGEAYCWGGNKGGQLGTGDKNSRRSPSRVLVSADP